MFTLIHAWFVTRPWYRLLLGSPAILLAGLVLLGALSQPFYRAPAIALRYRQRLAQAAQQQDVAQMLFAYHKLMQLNAADDALTYQMSLLMAESGRWDQAVAGMQRIAPVDQPGFTAAHAWLIQAITAGRLRLEETEAIALIDRHFEHLATLLPDEPALEIDRARFLAQTHRKDEALQRLQPLAEAHPQVRMLIASILAMDDQRDAGLAYLQQVAAELETKSARSPDGGRTNLTSAEYSVLVDAYRLLNQWPAAEETMRAAVAAYPDDKALQRFQAAFLVDLARRNVGDDPDDESRTLDLLSQALQADIGNAASWFEVMRLTHAEGAQGEQAQSFLAQLVTREDVPLEARFLVGTDHAARGQYREALVELEQVVRENPEQAVAWNNLAWVLSAIGDELPRAKECADRAVKLAPEDLRFRETRGQIHAKLEMWDECIADLEAALPAYKDDASVQDTLERARARKAGSG